MQGISRRYRITATLPGGGMADVFLAEDTQHYNEQVVIKQFKSGLDDSLNRLRKLFEREIQVLYDLDHPHIIKIRDWGSAGGHESRPYYVMPYMKGGSLQQKISRQKKFNLAETIKILQPLAQALDYAHNKGVRHFDVKPANILFDERGHLYLSDFGLALDSNVTVVQIDGVGTASYMSPEQLNVDRVELDHRVDLYALGVIIFQMLAGVLPFTGSLEAIIVQHLLEPVPDIYLHRPDLPVGLQPIFDKALAKDRTRRFNSAGEMLKALQSILGTVRLPSVSVTTSELPIAQQPTSRFPPPQRHSLNEIKIINSKSSLLKRLMIPLFLLLVCGFIFILAVLAMALSSWAKNSELTTIMITQVTKPDSQPTALNTTLTVEAAMLLTIISTSSGSLTTQPSLTISPTPSSIVMPTATSTFTPTPTPAPTETPTETPTATAIAVRPRITLLLPINCSDQSSRSGSIPFEFDWSGRINSEIGNQLQLRIYRRSTATEVYRTTLGNEHYAVQNDLWAYNVPLEDFFREDTHDYEWQIVYVNRFGTWLDYSIRGCFRYIPGSSSQGTDSKTDSP